MEGYYFVLGKKGEGTNRFMETFEAAKRDLGIDALRDHVYQRLNNLEDSIIDDFYVPMAKQMIREFLKQNTDAKTSEVTDIFYINGHSQFLCSASHKAFSELQKSAEIIATSHGSGHQRTWRLKEEH